ncbi:hypothetical protein LTR53_003299 [Teratosphaeriaceae sp. CCFEE 6253]|nr:hypothetical protein LTR53_003299 [Teratosphaeriaceae sp. CCFEE 6253]
MAGMHAPQSFAKRQSLRDRLDRIQYEEDEEAQMTMRFQLMEELDEDYAESKVFREHAPATQSRWMNNIDPDTLSEDEQTKKLFPPDSKALAYQLSLFVTYAFRESLPRSRAAGSIQIRTLVSYRDSMLYWANFYYQLREEALPRAKIFNSMVKSMRHVQHKYGDPLLSKEKPWLGLAELRQLLDHETITNRSIEVSEQHQLLWCIGRVTALRAGSLVLSGKYARVDPLTWRSLEFTLGAEPGQFDVRLTLDHIDIKQKEDTVVRPEAPISHRLVIRMPGPQAHNLVFSPAHRLLVIALRRGILESIETIDDLLAWDLNVISIEESHLDDPVFCASVPKGEAIDLRRPMRAHAVTEYLQRRGYQLGYSIPLTWYAIRRRAATDMARRIGAAATRIFLGHTPDSQTLERYYLNFTETIDNISTLLDQTIQPGGHSSARAAVWAPLALGRIDDENLLRIRGLALTQLTQRLILADLDGPGKNTPAAGLKQYRRRVRRFAQQQLVAKEAEWQRKNVTRTGLQQRVAALEASQFASEVLSKALDDMHSDRSMWTNPIGDANSAEEALDDPADEDGSLFVTARRDPVEPELDAEPDLESTLVDRLAKDLEVDESGAITLAVDTEPDTEASKGQALNDIAFVDLARSAMQLWLDNSLSQHMKWSQGDKKCPVCQDDDTVTVKQAMHEYGSADKLEAHLDSHFHHPVSKWRRTVERQMRTSDGLFGCPFCHQLKKPTAFKTVLGVLKHVVDSSRLTDGRPHDELKAQEGFYDEEFANALNLGPTARSVQKYMARSVEKLSDLNVDTSPEHQLLAPAPYHNSKTIVRGSHPSNLLPARYQLQVQSGPPEVPSAQDAVPPHLRGIVATGYMDTTLRQMPLHFRDDVMMTNYIRSQEEAEEDQEMEGR